MLRADVAGASSRIKSTYREPNRRFGVSVPRQIGTDKRQEDLQPPPSVRENQTGDGFQGVHGEKSKDTGDESWKELKKQNYPGGVKRTTKELRDYFATQVCAQVSDPNTVKHLMRHTSLTTTSKYVRTVTDRMKEAVQKFGGKFWRQLRGQVAAQKYTEQHIDKTGYGWANSATCKGKTMVVAVGLEPTTSRM
jgi:hypothetical protein